VLVLVVALVVGGAGAVYVWSTLNRVLAGAASVGEMLPALGVAGLLGLAGLGLARWLAPLAPPGDSERKEIGSGKETG
jgi:hypothetical protein